MSSSWPIPENGNITSSGTTNQEGEKHHQFLNLNYGQRNFIIVVVLIGLIVVLFITLLCLILPPFFSWLSQRRRRPSAKEMENRTERRYETIEGWLISKRVIAHSDDCTIVQNEFCRKVEEDDYNEATISGGDTPKSSCTPKSVCSSSSMSFSARKKLGTPTNTTASPKSLAGSPKSIPGPDSFDPNSSYDSEDTAKTDTSTDEEMEEKECPICMEAFAVGDIVSWSPNPEGSCRHVFHHECLKEWMLQSGDCPCCRELILPIDEEGLSLEHSLLKELCKKRAQLAASTYYCNSHGLVCFNKPGRYSRKMFECVKEITSCQITPQDLVDRRGDRVKINGGESVSWDSSSSPPNETIEPSSDNEADTTTLLLGCEDQQLSGHGDMERNVIEAMEEGETQ